MPFGITVAGDVFQRKLNQYFGKIDNVIIIADDIIVVGKQQNHRDHDIALTNLLETTRKTNIHLNYDKLHYKKTEVDFFWETYTTDSCKPAQSKVSVISEMPLPTCKKQVQSFISMINYLSKFLARLLELAEPIRELSKDKVPFNWGPEHHASFKQIKSKIIRAPILVYYNPKKEATLQTDASIKGLGACLLQDQKLVYFVSKVLMETQHRNQITSSSLDDGEISSLPVCKSLHSGNGSKTVGGHTIKESEPSNTQVAKNPNKNFSLQLHHALHTRSDKSTFGLLVPNGRSKRHH